MKKESYEQILNILRTIPAYQMTVDQLTMLSEAKKDLEKAYEEEHGKAQEKAKKAAETLWIDEKINALEEAIEDLKDADVFGETQSWQAYLLDNALYHLKNFRNYALFAMEEQQANNAPEKYKEINK